MRHARFLFSAHARERAPLGHGRPNHPDAANHGQRRAASLSSIRRSLAGEQVDGLDGLLAEMWARLTDLVHFAGPWGPFAVWLAALLLVIGRRYHFISFPGVLLLLAVALFLLTIRAIEWGRFY